MFLSSLSPRSTKFVIHLVAHLFIGRGRQADPIWFGNAFQAGSDVDAVAHQVAVALLDYIAKMNTDAEFDTALGCYAGITLEHSVLHFDGATNSIDDTPKLDEEFRHRCA